MIQKCINMRETKRSKSWRCWTSKNTATQLTGGYLPCQESCAEFSQCFGAAGASEALGSQANNVFAVRSQELSFLVQNSLLQIAERAAKAGITLAPNVKLINSGIKQQMKCVWWDLPHKLLESRELLGREETLSQNDFLSQLSSEKIE